MLYLVEDFLSIQGEGKYAGVSSIFFRFGGCNFSCAGFNVAKKSPNDNNILVGCDSLFAVNSAFKGNWKKIFDSKELTNILASHEKPLNYIPHVVVTGGEPLINYKNLAFYNFIFEAIKTKHKITVETNASIELDFEKYPIYKELVFSMSVKLENSFEPKEKRLNFGAISQICDNAKEAFFKFVVDEQSIKDKSAITQIKEIVENYKNVPIYCMALGKDEKELVKNSLSVVNFCIENGYNYSDRVHVRIWNDKVGV